MATPITDQSLIELGFEEKAFVKQDHDDIEYFEHSDIIGLVVRKGRVRFALADYPEIDTVEKLSDLIKNILK